MLVMTMTVFAACSNAPQNECKADFVNGNTWHLYDLLVGRLNFI